MERSTPLFKEAAIVGVGLIGGSLGLAIKRKNLAGKVTGLGRNIKALETALEYGAVDRISLDSRSVSGCDLIILATPVGTTPSILTGLAPHIGPGTIVTDVGSTKAEIVEKARDILKDGGIFIGGHPMAGSEIEGFSGADPYLFENAFYVLTPSPDIPGGHVDMMLKLVEGIGAKPVIMDPLDHDLAVAAVSHLPHLVAATLVNSLFDLPGGENKSFLAAGGFRDTTRIAAGSPAMWRDIFITNRQSVLDAIQSFKKRLDEFEGAILQNDPQKIYDLLLRAKTLKAGMPARRKGYLPVLWEIVVTVPDRPGVIAELAGILGGSGININDIEILRVREGEGGTIRLAFAGENDQEAAVALLNEAGIPAKKRP
ncbi:MAG: prephenate dehydrogenase/arogenate dehydrogenase family protein [Bacillota bacterium]